MRISKFGLFDWQQRVRALVATLLLGGALTAQGAAPTEAALVERGAYLAKAADCVACHTEPGGRPFAGGLKMQMPMGAIYTTNITPDTDTRIGSYTESEFARALRAGVAKDGHNLYSREVTAAKNGVSLPACMDVASAKDSGVGSRFDLSGCDL